MRTNPQCFTPKTQQDFHLVTPECCPRKIYKGDTYDLLEEMGDTIFFKCKDQCVYKKVGVYGSRFCFKSGGHTMPTCEVVGVSIGKQPLESKLLKIVALLCWSANYCELLKGIANYRKHHLGGINNLLRPIDSYKLVDMFNLAFIWCIILRLHHCHSPIQLN